MGFFSEAHGLVDEIRHTYPPGDQMNDGDNTYRLTRAFVITSMQERKKQHPLNCLDGNKWFSSILLWTG
jgi:hypothetical protein